MSSLFGGALARVLNADLSKLVGLVKSELFTIMNVSAYVQDWGGHTYDRDYGRSTYVTSSGSKSIQPDYPHHYGGQIYGADRYYHEDNTGMKRPQNENTSSSQLSSADPRNTKSSSKTVSRKQFINLLSKKDVIPGMASIDEVP
jgi:hypothetical protein